MKNVLKTTFVLAISAFTLAGCNLIDSPLKGHFSQKVASIEEPQTDDERTLMGEFNDYLALTDSLAAIWDGTDTINLRRLMYEIGEQENRIDKARRFQNVRRSMETNIKERVNTIKGEIKQKFPKEMREEWFDFYSNIYHCSSIWKNDYNRPSRNEKVYQNTLGEFYVIRTDHNGKSKKVPVYFEDGKYMQDFIEEVKFKSVDIIKDE